MKNKTLPTSGKLLAHFAMAVYDDNTRQMLDYKSLINQHKKETREWWNKLSANKYGKLLEGIGRNKDGTQRVKSSDTINFIRKR